MTRGKIILTFDVEEFDIPAEYGRNISFEEQIQVTTTGLLRIVDLAARHRVKCTFFTTAVFAQQQPRIIREISQQHEIASHGVSHSSFSPTDLRSSKTSLESILGRPVNGFRMARFASVDDSVIEQAGYTYNSSLNPTWIPGRYNSFHRPRLPFKTGKLLNIPLSVTPVLRIPLFWLSLKNMPQWLFHSFMLRTLGHDGFLSLYVHPWECADIGSYGLPWYIGRTNGMAMLKRVEDLIRNLKDNADFITMSEFCSSWTDANSPTPASPP
ncbi:MAG TPA: polysaccharide deacetylase family protein [Bacteroidota bacterium]